MELKQIDGYPHYMASRDGRIFSLYTNMFIKSHVCNSTGYSQVTLCENKIKHQRNVHRIIAETFIPNPDGLPCVNHKDEIRTNNSASNLEWCTYKYNTVYGSAIEKRMSHWTRESLLSSQRNAVSYRMHPVINKTTGIKYKSIADASRDTGCCHTGIVGACTGRYHTSLGYEWSYCEEAI